MKKMGSTTAAIALAIGLGLGGGSIAAANAWQTQAVSGQQTTVSGCVISFWPENDGRPTIHANAAHQCAGVKRVFVNADGWVEVEQTVNDPAKNPILFAFVQTDETLSGRGIIGGASGGTGSTRFRFYDTSLDRPLDLNKSGDRARMSGRNSNAWVGWVHSNS